MHFATALGSLPVLEAVLKKLPPTAPGATAVVDLQAGPDKETALHVAVKLQLPEEKILSLVVALLDAKAKAIIKDAHSKTPMAYRDHGTPVYNVLFQTTLKVGNSASMGTPPSEASTGVADPVAFTCRAGVRDGYRSEVQWSDRPRPQR